jgi:hypothetical protein
MKGAPPLPWGEGWGEGVRSVDRVQPLTRRYAPTSPHGRGEADPANDFRFHHSLPAQNDNDDTTRTFWAGSSFCTPSTTILAPSSTPPAMTTLLLS